MAEEVRLQKYIADCGAASRRGAEELIAAGRVKVDGRPAQIGQSVIPGKARVTLDGKALRPPEAKTYIALNKPRGYVTTLNDELGRKCVRDLLTGVGSRVYPVGRLDKDSEGLLILTDDGEFANALAHPRHHVPKVYHASVRPAVTVEALESIREGIVIDGRKTAPAEAKLLSSQDGRSSVEITLFEGRNRQIRKMCEALGLEVARLSRVSVGGVKLGGLPSGKWRELEKAEVAALLRMSGEERTRRHDRA